MEDFEFYADEEEEAAAGEGANRTFIFAVAGLGGLLVVGICIIIGFWAFVLRPQQARNQVTLATNTAVAAAAAETATVNGQLAPTDTPQLTDTPQPAPTGSPTVTQVPSTSVPTATATPAEVAGGEVTAQPTATLRPTATSRPTSTPTSAGAVSPPDTGIGVFGAGALAVGLVCLLVVVRRLRRVAQ